MASVTEIHTPPPPPNIEMLGGDGQSVPEGHPDPSTAKTPTPQGRARAARDGVAAWGRQGASVSRGTYVKAAATATWRLVGSSGLGARGSQAVSRHGHRQRLLQIRPAIECDRRGETGTAFVGVDAEMQRLLRR